MLRLRAADIFDMAELCGASTVFEWRVAREMLARGLCWAAEDESGVLVALGGLYPRDDGSHELWFAPGAPASRHMLALARLTRLTLCAGSYGEIVTVCRTRAGKRLARAIGFQFMRCCDAPQDDWEIWRCRPSLVAEKTAVLKK